MAQRFTVNGFKGGIDKRRTELTSLPGTLVSLDNGHINEGGEIEKRKALFPCMDQYFMKQGETYGLNVESQGFVVHGSGATPTLVSDYTGLANQVLVTIVYLGAGYTPSLVYTAGQATVSHSSGANIGVVNTSTTGAGVITITNNNTANPTVVFSGTWANADVVTLTYTVNAVATVVTFTVKAMPAASFTTTDIASQLAAALRVTWPQGTNISVSVSANVVTMTIAGGPTLTVTNTGSVTAAGTLTIGGSTTATVTITVTGTWLISDLLLLKVKQNATVDTRFSGIIVKYATPGFTSLALSGGGGTAPPITYQRLNPPTLGLSSPTLSGIIESCTFSDKTFAIATFSDNYNYLYYNGSVIPDSFVGYVYSYMVNGTASVTRANILKQFGYSNAGSILSIDPGVAAADTLTFYEGVGPAPISRIIVSSFSASTGLATTGAGNTVVLSGQWAAGDWISITVVDSLSNSYQYGYGNVTALQNPVFCFPYKNKVYVLDNTNGGLLNGSKVGDATIFNDPEQTGTVQIGLTQNSNLADSLVTACGYQGNIAIFFRSSIQIWSLQDNPALNSLVQTLTNVGCVSKRAVVPIGQLDVVFLSDSGFRSLRVRDSSNNAFVVDVGSPIDADITAILGQYNTIYSGYNFFALGGYEPIENRLVFALGVTIAGAISIIAVYVLSYYPESRITAWNTYTWSCFLAGNGSQYGLGIEKFITWRSALYSRGSAGFTGSLTGGDGIVVYNPSLIGRVAYNAATDASQVTGETPWWDAKHMEIVKDSEAVDCVMKGWWQVETGFDPLGSSATKVAVPYATAQPTPDTAADSTFGKGCFSIRLRGSHIKMKFYTKPGYTGSAKFAAVTALYQPEDQE